MLGTGGQSGGGRCCCPALYVQEKVGTAAAMATVGRVADLETMGQQHGLSLNLPSCNSIVSLAINRGFYYHKDHNYTVIDFYVSKGCLV